MTVDELWIKYHPSLKCDPGPPGYIAQTSVTIGGDSFAATGVGDTKDEAERLALTKLADRINRAQSGA